MTETLLKDMVNLLRVLVHPVAKQMLQDEFFTNGEPQLERIRVYSLIDGNLTYKAVAERTEVSRQTVNRWVNEWKRKGLVDQEGRPVFAFSDFFPDVPFQGKTAS